MNRTFIFILDNEVREKVIVLNEVIRFYSRKRHRRS